MSMRHHSRRDVLIGAAATAGAAASGAAARAQIAPIKTGAGLMQPAIRRIVGDKPVHKGRVKLEIPPLVENGNTVQFSVSVLSPMTTDDHVKAIHVFNEKNPQPYVLTARLGPRAGPANVTSRVRLADSQQVVAIAEMSDGSYWSDSADVIVTIAACTEGDAIP